MTTNKMPTVEDIRACVENLDSHTTGGEYWRIDQAMGEASEMLLTIAEHMRKSEPAAWAVINDNGEMIPCRGEANARRTASVYHYPLVPLYAVPFADAEDARFYRFLVEEATPNEVKIWSVHLKGDQENYLRKCMVKRDAAMEMKK